MFMHSTSTISENSVVLYSILPDYNNGFLLMELLISLFFVVSFLIMVHSYYVISMHSMGESVKRMYAVDLASSYLEKLIYTHSPMPQKGAMQGQARQREFQILWSIFPQKILLKKVGTFSLCYQIQVLVTWYDHQHQE